MTTQERIWREIKAADAPVGVGDISEQIGIDSGVVRKSLYALRRWCDLVQHGKGCATKYSVPPGGVYACPGRGNTEGSRRNLRPWNWQNGLAAIQARRSRGHSGRRAIPTPRPAIALEQCWPSMRIGR